MAEILFRSLLTLSLGSLLALPLVSVREIGRGFFTLWAAIVGALGVIGLGLRAWVLGGSTVTEIASGRDRASVLLAISLALLGSFWIGLRLGASRTATVVLIASALSGGLVLRELAIGPASTIPGSEGAVAGSREAAARERTGAQAASVEEWGRDSAGGPGPSVHPTAPIQEVPDMQEPALEEAALRVTSLLLSALAVGIVTVAMVLGHWYLVQPKLALAPLRRICDVFIGVLLVRLIVSGWGFAMSLRQGHQFLGQAEPVPWEILILSQRLLFGFGGSLILAVMIKKTVALRSTMSATGLLYIAILFVWVGEFLSIYLGRLTGGALVV